jgi:F0F1-type ATP synthase beta subunit
MQNKRLDHRTAHSNHSMFLFPFQVIGAVVDVEFDDVEDVPDILNALVIKVPTERYNKKNDQIRSASLLPKQIRQAKERLSKLQALDKEWVSKGTNKKVAQETLAFVKEAGNMDDEALKKLEATLGNKAAGEYFFSKIVDETTIFIIFVIFSL